MNISKRISEARALSGLTQKDLADAIGVSVQAVSQWETGKSAVSSARITQISRVLDVSEDFLSGKQVDHTPVDRSIYDRDSLFERMIEVIDLKDVVAFMVREKGEPEVHLSYEDHSGNLKIRGKGFGIYVSLDETEDKGEDEGKDETEFWIFDTGVIPADGDVVIVAMPKHPVFHMRSLGSEVDVHFAFRRFRKEIDRNDELITALEEVSGIPFADEVKRPAIVLATRIERRTFRKASIAE